MNIDMAKILVLVKKLLIIIFEKYDVTKEFEAIGVDIIGILEGDVSIIPED